MTWTRGGQKRWCTVCEEVAPFLLTSQPASPAVVSAQQTQAKAALWQSARARLGGHWSLQEAGMASFETAAHPPTALHANPPLA